MQELLGHADIKLTLGTYSHILPSMDGQTANTMESAPDWFLHGSFNS